MQLVNMDLGRVFDDRSTRKVTKDVVVKETVYRPDSVVREYAKVQATIITTTRTLRSHAVLQVTVRDENGRRIWSDQYSSTHSWSTRFSHFTGDERALSQEDKNQLNRRMDVPPSEHDMMKCMADEITNNAVYGLRSYFGRNS